MLPQLPNKVSKNKIWHEFIAAGKRNAEKNKKTDVKEQNMIAVGFFVVVVVISIIYTILNPKVNFAETAVIDESAILVHNGASYRYK